MNEETLKKEWLKIEKTAQIKGWEFTTIENEYEEISPPWDYKQLIEQHLKREDYILDIDTGGGEFLRTLNHPYNQMSATEGYLPNVQFCEKELKPLGIDFHEVAAGEKLPFNDETFHIVINRHGTLNLEEIYRVLKPEGLLITQQVGAENDRELIYMLLPDLPVRYEAQYLNKTVEKCRRVGFEILIQDESKMPIRFYTVESLIWFAKVIEWEFLEFSVEKCLTKLMKIKEQVEKKGYIEGKSHRYLVIVKK